MLLTTIVDHRISFEHLIVDVSAMPERHIDFMTLFIIRIYPHPDCLVEDHQITSFQPLIEETVFYAIDIFNHLLRLAQIPSLLNTLTCFHWKVLENICKNILTVFFIQVRCGIIAIIVITF